MSRSPHDPNAIFVTPPVPADGDAAAEATAAAALLPARWRVIVEEAPRSGAVNMALDQAIAEACAAGESLPTLRFYRWEPPAVSLGRHQSVNDVALEAVTACGYELVRRPTGGRAILHIDELTYSVAAPAQEPRVAGGVMDAYLRLSTALLAGLRTLGLATVDKAPGNVRAGADVSAACFEVPSAYEITVGTRKLMGSAQSRRAGYVLQHGSLPLTGDIARLVDVLALPAADAADLRRELSARACTLAQALTIDDNDPVVAFTHVADVLATAFGEQLNIEFTRAAPTPTELRRAAELVRKQFGAEAWTASR
jgi:lipoate-protein ligase A